jgi:hypothetical protein
VTNKERSERSAAAVRRVVRLAMRGRSLASAARIVARGTEYSAEYLRIRAGREMRGRAHDRD